MTRACTNVAIVGCGYVFDFYMAKWRHHPDLRLVGVFHIDAERLRRVSAFYGLKAYDSFDAVLADAAVEMVVNLTSIASHHGVTRRALEAGKHVYSEKPLVTDMAQARDLADLAKARGLVLSCAPSNLYSDSVLTMWQAVRAGAIGTPVLAYAEFDDSPIYLMRPETWRSASGAPWPFEHEYESGCTWEHAGYHLVWLCALLGPAVSVTALAKETIAHKAGQQSGLVGTPDFTVGLIHFASGAVARLTCSIVAPADHRIRVFGREGEISIDTYRDYQAPVRLERYSGRSLSGRRLRMVRESGLLRRLFGIGGRKMPLVRHARSQSRPSWFTRGGFRRRQEGEQDKVLGIALTAHAIREGGQAPFPVDFILHVTELTLAIQAAGENGATHRLDTRFVPFAPPASVAG